MLLRRQNLSRIINTVSKAKPSQFFLSKKMGQLIFCESHLEICGNKILEFDENVISIVTQPFTFEYKLGGAIRKYTPDFYVKTRKSEYILGEYKP